MGVAFGYPSPLTSRSLARRRGPSQRGAEAGMDARMATMPAYEGRLSRWGQMREWIRIGVRSHCRCEGAISLYFLPGTWYEEHAEEMLRLLVDTTGQLENALRLTLPPTDCYVTDPE